MSEANLTVINELFPFDEIRRKDGDYFANVAEAQSNGYDLDQIWAVIETDGVWSYAPPHHYINLIGYIATQERHNFKTYYNEPFDESEFID